MIDTWGRLDDFGIYFSFINEKYEDLLRFFSSKEISNFKLLSDVYKVKIKHFDSKHTQKNSMSLKTQNPMSLKQKVSSYHSSTIYHVKIEPSAQD